jgi:hypothetical protein
MADFNFEEEAESNKNRKRHGARNQHRHKFFVRWLLKTFPDQLATGNDNSVQHHHVLDVAGGKGELSARLCLCHGLHVRMIDPREANIAECYEQLILPRLPNKWQQSIEKQRAENPTFVQDLLTDRFKQMVACFDEHSLQTSYELQVYVERASLLIGLHADGATEAIVDAALSYNKPFVVVPCCVFHRQFRDRRVYEDGKLVPVRSHEQFCKYLAQKDPRFHVETLPFEGRNTAVWWDGL